MKRYGNGPHALYRLRDKDGHLLYVGCSLSPLARLSAHELHRVWATAIDNATFEWFPDRQTALAAETAAIKAERPEWNVHHKTNPKHAIGRFHDGYRRDDPTTWAVN